MKTKIISAVATGVLLAACQTPPQDVREPGPAMEAPAIPGSVHDFNQNVSNRAYFKFNRSDINHDAQHDLLGQADWLKQYPQMAAVVEGHTDERGTTEYNLGLGERRAENAKKFLLANGIGSHRIKTVSYGKEKLPAGPASSADDEATHKLNRVAVTFVE